MTIRPYGAADKEPLHELARKAGLPLTDFDKANLEEKWVLEDEHGHVVAGMFGRLCLEAILIVGPPPHDPPLRVLELRRLFHRMADHAFYTGIDDIQIPIATWFPWSLDVIREGMKGLGGDAVQEDFRARFVLDLVKREQAKGATSE